MWGGCFRVQTQERLVVGFNPFAAVVGALIPVKTSSKLLLKQEMKKYGIDPYSLPAALYDDLHESAYRMHKMMTSSRMELMDRMVQSMEYYAHAIAVVVRGQKTESYEQDLVAKIKHYLA